MELVHKALSMGGKFMLNNNGQSQYAQNEQMQGQEIVNNGEGLNKVNLNS